MNSTASNYVVTSTYPLNNTTPLQPMENASIFLAICEVVNAMVFVGIVWILISMILYGSRTKKWKKSGPSSMNSGMIYTTCIAVVALTIPRLLLNAVIFHIHEIKGGLEWCEFMFDASDVTGYASLYPIYFFLWLRHRVIYSHPSVHALTGRFVNSLSWITIVGLTLMSVGVLLFLVIPSSYVGAPQGCILNPDMASSMGYYVLAGLMILAQALLLGLFIYPMVRTNAAQKENTKKEVADVDISATPGDMRTSPDRKHGGSKFSNMLCFKRRARKPARKTNSVTRTIHRSTISAIITIVSDLAIVAITSWAVPPTTPLAITNAFYSVGILINVFCALATFGGRSRILMASCTTCTGKGTAGIFSDTADTTGSNHQSSNQNGTKQTGLNSTSAA